MSWIVVRLSFNHHQAKIPARTGSIIPKILAVEALISFRPLMTKR
jgi:hypothetical protein